MKRAATETMPPPRDIKRIRLDLDAAKAAWEKAKKANKAASSLVDELNVELYEHPERQAELAVKRTAALRHEMPAGLYEILVEDGDVAYGTLTDLHIDWDGNTYPWGVMQVQMTFSKTPMVTIKSDEYNCSTDDWDGTFRKVVTPRGTRGEPMPVLWDRALAANGQNVPKALAALVSLAWSMTYPDDDEIAPALDVLRRLGRDEELADL